MFLFIFMWILTILVHANVHNIHLNGIDTVSTVLFVIMIAWTALWAFVIAVVASR